MLSFRAEELIFLRNKISNSGTHKLRDGPLFNICAESDIESSYGFIAYYICTFSEEIYQ